jgi:hypothetical protein
MFYKIKRGIRNLWKWLPIIWKDEDFDYHYIYIALHFKLKNTYDFLTSKKAWGVHNSNHLKKLKICINLLKRIIDDHYMYFAISEFRHYDLDRDIFEGAIKLDNGNWRLREMTETERKEFLKYNAHCDYLLLQDKEMLFDTLKKYIMNWWD